MADDAQTIINKTVTKLQALGNHLGGPEQNMMTDIIEDLKDIKQLIKSAEQLLGL